MTAHCPTAIADLQPSVPTVATSLSTPAPATFFREARRPTATLTFFSGILALVRLLAASRVPHLFQSLVTGLKPIMIRVAPRSEERRVGKECGSRSEWWDR